MKLAWLLIAIGIIVNLINSGYHGWHFFGNWEAVFDGLAGLIVGVGIGIIMALKGIEIAMRKRTQERLAERLSSLVERAGSQ